MTVKLGIQTRSEVAEHQRANWETVSNLSLNRCIFLRIGIGIEVQNFKFCQVALGARQGSCRLIYAANG